MSTGFEKRIEQLETLVERRLRLCQAASNGIRCTLPENHVPAEGHRFPMEPAGLEHRKGAGA